jgi:hypothetical protein
MTGRDRKVSRILSVVVLALVAAGCGSSAASHVQADAGLPRALAQGWAARATAVANAAAAGDSCRASQLASSLRDEIIADEARVPARLQKPLVEGANALADRITCVTPPQTVTVAPAPAKPPKPKHEDHHHHKHGHGEEGDQG